MKTAATRSLFFLTKEQEIILLAVYARTPHGETEEAVQRNFLQGYETDKHK